MASSEASSDGPVLSLLSKRLRALRKKQNRIAQMEEALAQGKPLNPEQEEVLRSKPAVVALIDEYEKLRAPLSAAVQEELSRLTPSPSPPPSEPSPDEDVAVEDIVGLLYFGRLFDVMPQSEFTATMLTRTHERGCCLTYDYVTDDATELLGERDLDAISELGTLVTSRPASSVVSHKNALQGCVQHARLWLQRSDQPVYIGSSVTYAGLREKLKKIMVSDYFTTTPEMKAPVDVAAAAGKYNTTSQVQVPESTTDLEPAVQIDGTPADYHHEEDAQDLQETEISSDQPSPVDESPKALQDEADMLNPSGDSTSAHQEQQNPEFEEEQTLRDTEQKEQYIPRRLYQNQRGRGRGGGGFGGRRGYPNGRGGRGGRGGGGGYQNGRNQYYDPGYYPRNNYNTRGRGGRSGGSGMYNSHGAATHSDHVPAVN